MAIETIDFNKVIAYSKKNCVTKSKALCATYVKRAFEAGGCAYISGNGWSNQKFCKDNGFQCIGDFKPIDQNPRPTRKRGIQFPQGYVQQTGDICLIKHGQYGHICYATGPGINDWVSDYWQRPPGQQDGTGPYCYTGSVEQVQFWRHSSVMGQTPVISPQVETLSPDTTEDNNLKPAIPPREPVTPQNISGLNDNRNNDNIPGTTLGMHLRQN